MDSLIPKNSFKLLNVFLYKPRVQIHQNEIIRLSGLSKITVMKLLRLYADEGLLKESQIGNLKLFSLVEEHPVVKQLKVLINVTELYTNIKDFSGKNFDVYLFGSTARGEDTEDSDIDILILGKISHTLLNDLTTRIDKAMKRDVNPVVKSHIEYANLYNTDRAFFENIERDRIKLI